ncbi:MAG: hypothetical protein WCI73_04125 [Phycisphaerae bacterium]
MMLRTILLLCGATLAACGDNSTPVAVSAEGAGTPATPVTAAPALQPTGFGATTYFAQHCARCHGPEGQFWGERYGRNLPPPQLVEKIRMMAAGPGQAPVTDPQLATLTTFLQTIVARQPYAEVVTVNAQGADVTITGEAANDVTIQVEAGGKKYPVEVIDNVWTMHLTGVPTNTIRVIATKAKMEVMSHWLIETKF